MWSRDGYSVRSDDRIQAELCLWGTSGRKINAYAEQSSRVSGLTVASHVVNICFLHFYTRSEAKWLLLVLGYFNVINFHMQNSWPTDFSSCSESTLGSIPYKSLRNSGSNPSINPVWILTMQVIGSQLGNRVHEFSYQQSIMLSVGLTSAFSNETLVNFSPTSFTLFCSESKFILVLIYYIIMSSYNFSGHLMSYNSMKSFPI
jgi:hypothetical protein